MGTVGLNRLTALSMPINSLMLSPDAKSDEIVLSLDPAEVPERSSTFAK